MMCSIKMAERSIGRTALSGGGFLLCPHTQLLSLRARGANKGIWLKTVNFSLKFFPLFRVVLNGSENPAPTISRVFLDYMSNVTLARTAAIEYLR